MTDITPDKMKGLVDQTGPVEQILFNAVFSRLAYLEVKVVQQQKIIAELLEDKEKDEPDGR